MSRVDRLSSDTAVQASFIVSETFGGGWEGFFRYITEPGQSHEFRFQGALGWGGKLHLNAGRLYVSCYREDETPVLKAAMAHVNARLALLVPQVESR